MARQIVASSSFDGSESPLSEGGNWVQMITGSSIIKTNGVAFGAADQSLIRWAGPGAFTESQFASIELPAAQTAIQEALAGPIVNAGSADLGRDFLGAYIIYGAGGGSSGSSVETRLVRWLNAQQEILDSASFVWSAGDRLTVEHDAESGILRAYRNSSLILSSGSFAAVPEGGTPGVFARGTDLAFDNWIAGNLTQGSARGGLYGLGGVRGMRGMRFSSWIS